MNKAVILSILAFYLTKYFPSELDIHLKPKDSANCTECRNVVFYFIIVGAGSAGSVLANRLSENPEWKVLLLEAGGDEDYITDTPAVSGQLLSNKYHWNFTTIPQKATGKQYPYFMGNAMGGTSTINGMMYVRGNVEDFNHWERLGNYGWNYKDVMPYFLKVENMTISILSKSPYHSMEGPQYVGHAPYKSRLKLHLMKAGTQLGFPITDYNGFSQYGVAYSQYTMKGATRCSTSKAYLNPIRNRKNLYIFKNTLVKKLIFKAEKINKKAIGVVCITNGVEYDVYTRKEIILSDGAINTPKLLILSGIGPRKHLEMLGTPPSVNLPVGQTLMDHPGATLSFSINTTELHYNPYRVIKALKYYAKYRKGIISLPYTGPVVIFGRSKPGILDTKIEVYFDNYIFSKPTKSIIQFYVINLRPKSYGSIKLNSSNYMDTPLIDPNYFADKDELLPIKWGLRLVIDLMKTKAMVKYKPELWIENPLPCDYTEPFTDDALDCIIRSNAKSGFHPNGSARMGSRYDQTAVVDATLCVHHLQGLRVVDASVMPHITGGNINAPTIMIAEKAADIIKTHYHY